MRFSKSSFAFLVLCLSVLVARPLCAEQEVILSQGELQTLDNFEAANLLRAEKAFNAKQYKQAAIEYDAFATDFPSSPLIAYAYLKKGRSLQYDHKPGNAIKAYTDVVDNYKDATQHVAAAIFYIGECHFESGETEQAMKAWRRMIDDPAFSKSFLAATATNKLADYYLKQKQFDQASTCFELAAINFRDSNPESAREAIRKVIDYRVRTQPDEAKLREFYAKARGFDNDPIKVAEDTATDKRYWTHLLKAIKEHGTFAENEAEAKTAYYSYWATALNGKFADWDEYQLDAARFRLTADQNVQAWTERLDALYTAGKTDNPVRTIHFIRALAANKQKVAEYFGKLNLDALDNDKLQDLMRICYHEAKMPELGRKAFEKLKLDKWNDEQKQNCAWNVLLFQDEASYTQLCESISDKELGQVLVLRYFHGKHDTPTMYVKAFSLCNDLKTSTRFASEAFWKKAEMLHWQGKFAEAIQAYMASDNKPDNFFRIGDCYVQLGKKEQAVEAYTEVERTDKGRASDAAWRIACLYKDNSKLYIPKLRSILDKYPTSSESSNAHRELEKLHVDIGGGVIDEQR